MPAPPSDASSLIDALGGSKKTSQKIGRPFGTVASWKHRNAIPSEAWPAFIDVAHEEDIAGITAAHLLSMHSGPAARAEGDATIEAHP